MWKAIYLHLKSKGLAVYSPGQHSGPCTSSYVVLRDAGVNAFAGTNQVGYALMDVIVYHPVGQYSTLGDYVQSIRSAMKKIPEARFTGYETPVLMEEEKQGYTTSLQYQIMKRI
ncbi:MAG: hypothetical protein GT589_08675 [Peptoclostridium sp.]|uniref:hypothetical protein n=1 Tax=Peptoclostridium sp. TaxID=1904860 RepID=UPI00139D8B02|nr:hypothetical protein [Peptoclostridium sp.]MZQ76206.1 hypothetical protein [Peptoclostridium sp.]